MVHSIKEPLMVLQLEEIGVLGSLLFGGYLPVGMWMKC